jgi:hypothetical protein
MRKCVYRKQLDLETLVATRGPNFPISRLETRLMCPACGNRRVTVVFEPPSNAKVVGGPTVPMHLGCEHALVANPHGARIKSR